MHYISRKRPLKHLDFSTQDRWLCIEYHIKFISIYIVFILEIRFIKKTDSIEDTTWYKKDSIDDTTWY